MKTLFTKEGVKDYLFFPGFAYLIIIFSLNRICFVCNLITVSIPVGYILEKHKIIIPAMG